MQHLYRAVNDEVGREGKVGTCGGRGGYKEGKDRVWRKGKAGKDRVRRKGKAGKNRGGRKSEVGKDRV